jgi:hypothetical protein
MDGVTPVCIAPNLFKKVHFKRRSVAKELQNNNWMSAACHISTRHELLEFVKLWSLLKNVRLLEMGAKRRILDDLSLQNLILGLPPRPLRLVNFEKQRPNLRLNYSAGQPCIIKSSLQIT